MKESFVKNSILTIFDSILELRINQNILRMMLDHLEEVDKLLVGDKSSTFFCITLTNLIEQIKTELNYD